MAAAAYTRYVAVGTFFVLFLYIFFSGHDMPSPREWLSFTSNGDPTERIRRVRLSNHPIPKLMDAAADKHRKMLSSQSKTLAKAVQEYRRRYKRDPPKGFDGWWEFAQEHNVKMIDEYDSMISDLEPFWGLSPVELRRRAFQMSSMPAVDLVRVARGRAYTARIKRPGVPERPVSERAAGFIMMLEPFQSVLPDMDFPISTKSEGRVIVPWEHLHYPNLTIQDSSKGLASVIGGPFVEDWRGEGSVWEAFRRSCPPDAPARRLFGTIRGQSYTVQKSVNLLRPSDSQAVDPSILTFSNGVENQFDFCSNPWGRSFQGHFFSDWRTLPSLYPIFSPAKAPGYNDIVIPSHYYYAATKRYTYGIDPVLMITKERDNFEIEWEDKKDKIFWRGATTGGGSSPPGFLHQYQRHRLVRLTGNVTDRNTTVIFPEVVGTDKYVSAQLPASDINPEIFDIAFTVAIGCSQYKQGGCKGLRDDHRFANSVQLTDHWKYKYLIDVDGMGYSAHFLAFMASESAVIKNTVYREFFSDWIQPWLHYIPVSQSYAELYNIHTYFSGPTTSMNKAAATSLSNYTAPFDTSHATRHEGDERLRKIARAGRQWKMTTTRREDMQAYVYRLALEWARLWNDDREAMSFVL